MSVTERAPSARIPDAIKGIIPDLLSIAPSFTRLEQATGIRRRIGALTEARAADRAQIDHQQDLVVGRRGAAVVIVGHVVERNGEAVVDVAESDPGRIDLMRLDIVAGRGEHAPVLRELEG